MGGFLYKDYLAIRGRKVLLAIALFFVLYGSLRALFPGERLLPGLTMVDGEGKPVNVLDTFFVMAESLVLLSFVSLLNGFVGKIAESDEKSKILKYLAAMPAGRRSYVASKYIFIGICNYVFLSLFMMLHVVDMAFILPEGGFIEGFGRLLMTLAIPFFSLSILVAALELPLFLLLGKGKAMYVKVGLIMILGLFVVWFLLFGNLDLFENWDVGHLIDWAERHEFGLTFFVILSPFVTLALYYASYRLTAVLWERKEGANG
jgi:hypothetical protein